MGGQLLPCLFTSSPASQLRQFKNFIPRLTVIRSWSKSSSGHGIHVEEKAPSTAEEFKRVAEEKKTHQGIANQTLEKSQDAVEEVARGDGGDLRSVKERYKDLPSSKANVHTAGD